jgi:hypothetical protein
MVKKVISVHEYALKPGADPVQFERAILQARAEGLLELPGLEDYFLLKGIRGTRDGQYTAVWVYESKSAWEALWGPEGQPLPKAHYPKKWKIWEDQVLAPFLAQDPDQIAFTSYQEL